MDDEGKKYLMMDEMIDHRTDDTAIPFELKIQEKIWGNI